MHLPFSLVLEGIHIVVPNVLIPIYINVDMNLFYIFAFDIFTVVKVSVHEAPVIVRRPVKEVVVPLDGTTTLGKISYNTLKKSLLDTVVQI